MEAEHQNWKGRAHFFKAAAEAMRRILVENARRKKSLKRGGDRQRVKLDESLLVDVQDIHPDVIFVLQFLSLGSFCTVSQEKILTDV